MRVRKSKSEVAMVDRKGNNTRRGSLLIAVSILIMGRVLLRLPDVGIRAASYADHKFPRPEPLVGKSEESKIS